ncbi:hypothetical protein NS365_03060 [Aureimonas ureilytica]|uniref:Short-chain dehydrogenase n=1 Tax=Aureimonas ureilytica TaxID=401562 RepID=A0A175RVM1_9HYPH|nr:SDR family oxidoreductase [Aureimonas ureilytica]KTR07577.1 hypothetical protein NS365_03060 [Aureimonas ureilytica]
MNISGDVIVVTGGASGIGEACASVLAQSGAKVAILDRNLDLSEAVAKKLGGRAFEVDVTDEKSVIAAIEAVEREFGPIAGGVTSAGIVQPPFPAATLPLDIYDRVHAINTRGTFLCLREMGRHMLKRASGSLVAISSITARCSTPLHSYGPGKAAISNLVAGLAVEWGRGGLRVNSVEPGYTRTPALQAQIDSGMRDETRMTANTAMGRMVETTEVANVVAFLISSASSAVTGVSIPVDVGFALAGSWAPYGGVPGADNRVFGKMSGA